MRELFVIRTPENVAFEYELAGIGTRALAWTVDVCIIATLIVASSILLSFLSVASGALGQALQFVVLFVIQWWYGALSEWALRGRTLGKMALGLRVVGDRGLRITFLQAAIRNLVRTADFLPFLYAVGGTCALLDPYGRRLGDLAAGTLVIVERKTTRPSAVLPESERHNSFASDPAVGLAARRITPPEREVLIALSLRREELPLRVRHELFERLADHLSRRLGVERPSFFSPEKFVVQLAAIVLRQSESKRGDGKASPARATSPF